MTHFNKIKGLLTILSISGFAIIAYFVSQNAVLPFDLALQNFIFSLRSDWLTAFAAAFTVTGNWQPITVLCVALLTIPQTRKHYGVPMTISAVLSVTFYEALKFIFQRPRPDVALRLIEEGGFSFPSGHTLTSLVFWGTAIFLIHWYSTYPEAPSDDHSYFPHIRHKKTAHLVSLLLSVYILLMGLSRIYLGVHYPTDVLGSWFLGTCMLLSLHTVYLSGFRPSQS